MRRLALIWILLSCSDPPVVDRRFRVGSHADLPAAMASDLHPERAPGYVVARDGRQPLPVEPLEEGP